MSENTVLGSMPNRRPHRRSARRGPTPAVGAPVKPASPTAPEGSEALSLAVLAAAELATIGISASAKALRGAVARLPRA